MSDTRTSPSEIEREVERSRSDVGETIDELRDRLSPEAAVQYGANYLRGPAGQRLLGAVRQNPLAAVIALVGVGWLVYTANRPQSEHPRPARDRRVDGGVRQSSFGASRPGVMGDGTEEQNLNQPGDPSARITQQEVEEAFRHEPSSAGSR